MNYTYEYPRPALTVDAIIFLKTKDELKVLLIERRLSPFQGYWALPGGFVNIDETVEEAILRELEEETGITNITLNQFKVYSDVNRDPRGRIVSVTFYGVIKDENYVLHPNDDAKDAKWFPINYLPKLAFDHEQILNDALDYLKSNK